MPDGGPVTTMHLLTGSIRHRIAAIDEAVAADLEMRLIGALDARRKHVTRHHRAAQRQACRLRSRRVRRPPPRRRSRAAPRPDRAGSAAAVRPTPRRAGDKARLAENRQHRRGRHPVRGHSALAAEPFRRMPGGEHRRRPFAREQSGLGKAKRHRRRQDQRCGALVAALAREHLRIERMMQRQRAAGQEPGHQRQADAGKRGWRKRRQYAGVLFEPAFKKAPKPPARNSRWRRATGSGPSSPTSNVVTARCAAALAARSSGGTGSSFAAVNRSSSATTPSGRLAPKPQT